MSDSVSTIDLDKDFSDSFRIVLEDIKPGRFTGLRDRKGEPLYDGDRILDFNHMGNGEKYADIKAGRAEKMGFPGVVRRYRWAGYGDWHWGSVTTEDGETCYGGLAANLVEKVNQCQQDDRPNQPL